MATCSSILAWKIPWSEDFGGLHSMGSESQIQLSDWAWKYPIQQANYYFISFCVSWATWCEELTHWKGPWCWERLKAGEGDDRGWDGWMASSTRWIWVWASSGRWWWAGEPGVLQSMELQRVGHDLVTKQQQCCSLICFNIKFDRFHSIWRYILCLS